MFDFNIWKGKNLNAIGIVISIYVILISLFGKRYFYDYISDFFTIIMVLFFSKGIKNVFKQVVETEVDKNSKTDNLIYGIFYHEMIYKLDVEKFA